MQTGGFLQGPLGGPDHKRLILVRPPDRDLRPARHLGGRGDLTPDLGPFGRRRCDDRLDGQDRTRTHRAPLEFGSDQCRHRGRLPAAAGDVSGEVLRLDEVAHLFTLPVRIASRGRKSRPQTTTYTTSIT